MAVRNYSNTFVPIIGKNDYDDYAAEFLRRYGYADAITIPQAVPIWEIAQKKMQLCISFARLSQNGDDISGLIALDDGLVDIYDDTISAYIGLRATKGMVLLEALCSNAGRQNNSLAHECVHWWLHRLFFANKRGGGDAVAFRCPRRWDSSTEEISDKERMEIQARQIGGRILMPKAAALIRVKELLAKQGLTTETATEEQFKELARELSNTFQISQEAALVRLSQLGYIQYTVQPRQDGHSTDRQRVPQERRVVGLRTLQLDAKDILQEFSRNEVLQELFAKGQFRFVDGYFVINNPKYITHTADTKRLPILTQYAKEHLDECTLGFIFRRQNKGIPQSLTEILFKRQRESDYSAEAAYINDNANSAVLVKAARVTKQQTALAKKYAEFKAIRTAYTLGEAIDIILKERTLQGQEAGWQAEMAPSQITRLKSDKHKPSMRLMTQFCAGLGLELHISYDLIAKAGISLISPTKEDFAYMMILSTMSGNGISDINKYLIEVGIEPFNIAK